MRAAYGLIDCDVDEQGERYESALLFTTQDSGTRSIALHVSQVVQVELI